MNNITTRIRLHKGDVLVVNDREFKIMNAGTRAFTVKDLDTGRIIVSSYKQFQHGDKI